MNAHVIAICIGCGCDDDHACDLGCTWLRVDYERERGVCSSCPDHEARFDAGDLELSDTALIEREFLEDVDVDLNEKCEHGKTAAEPCTACDAVFGLTHPQLITPDDPAFDATLAELHR